MQDEWERGNIRSIEVRRAKALDRARALIPALQRANNAIEMAGETVTHERVAEWLSAHDVPPPGRGSWHKESVRRLKSINQQHAKTCDILLDYQRKIAEWYRVPGRAPDVEVMRSEKLWREAQAAHAVHLKEAAEVARALRSTGE